MALGWSDATLASRARLGAATVQRAESAKVPPITVGNLFAIQRALEEGGVIFIEDGQQNLFRRTRRPTASATVMRGTSARTAKANLTKIDGQQQDQIPNRHPSCSTASCAAATGAGS